MPEPRIKEIHAQVMRAMAPEREYTLDDLVFRVRPKQERGAIREATTHLCNLGALTRTIPSQAYPKTAYRRVW